MFVNLYSLEGYPVYKTPSATPYLLVLPRYFIYFMNLRSEMLCAIMNMKGRQKNEITFTKNERTDWIPGTTVIIYFWMFIKYFRVLKILERNINLRIVFKNLKIYENFETIWNYSKLKYIEIKDVSILLKNFKSKNI